MHNQGEPPAGGSSGDKALSVRGDHSVAQELALVLIQSVLQSKHGCCHLQRLAPLTQSREVRLEHLVEVLQRVDGAAAFDFNHRGAPPSTSARMPAGLLGTVWTTPLTQKAIGLLPPRKAVGPQRRPRAHAAADPLTDTARDILDALGIQAH